MAEVDRGFGHEEEVTKDGSVDLKGRPFIRSKGGRWTACSFIVGYEVFERMAYYGIATNLVLYLTDKLHEGTVSSSNNVTNWVGTGMSMLTLTVSLHSLRPPECCNTNATPLQVGIFYLSLYIIAVGTGGTKPNISTMGADQFDDFDPKERKQKLSFFNWWMFSIFFGTLFANTLIIYVQDDVGWGIGYGIPTAGLLISILVFLVGTPFYRHKIPTGSPFTVIARVLVAAIRKWRAMLPNDSKELYELSLEEFLDKAAMKSGPDTPWMLCPVTQVEETKRMMKMLPVLLVSIIPSVMAAQVNTLFVKQGKTLNRSMGPHFKIPPASLAAFVTIFMLISLVLYDRFLVPFVRKYTKNPRGITLLQRMGIGLAIHVLIMIVASLTERYRLKFVRDHGLVDEKTIPLSIFILLPQFALMGIADTFVEVAKIEFFYDQAPEGMKSLGTSYFTTTLGLGNFLSSILLKAVSQITMRGGREGWIQDNLNASQLDYYYGFFALLSVLNLTLFMVVSTLYSYNSERMEAGDEIVEDGAARQREDEKEANIDR
ncbi:Protein NRT1/ PTR FAMILY 5.2 [Ananas comosus]|uniref:Protein NRT1/ PTR FAMILY 5.2 n=1 Tax=Ananas comosus TaxID=4615 RepID=A0A199W8W8_ANACO|nr:Protein NRT1/ PTR FAMILY 5.2 [Ananas comosus]